MQVQGCLVDYENCTELYMLWSVMCTMELPNWAIQFIIGDTPP
jgi:hypothetical protein